MNSEHIGFDFAGLSESLDQRLKEHNLGSTGLCPERHEVYKDCLDEVVLEVTNIDPDQGALISRIRDELNMTSDAYKKLYESSVSFGLTKAIEARHENEKLHAKIDEIDENLRKKSRKTMSTTKKRRRYRRQRWRRRRRADERKSRRLPTN